MPAQKTISVVICAYSEERTEQLQQAIRSALDQSVAPLEVVVVIDHNADLLHHVKTTFPEVKAFPNFGAQGLSAARNTGVMASRGTIIAFLDDDAMADRTWLETMVRHYDDAKVIGVGGGVVPKWPGNASPRWFPDEFLWVLGCSYKGLPEKLAPVRNVIGCNMSFRRTLFDQIGGFGEAMGRRGADAAGCEETEFCIKAVQARPDARILYDPVCRVLHQISEDRVHWSYFRKRCLAEGRSKALMVRSVGSQDGLASERDYMFKTLPIGILRGFGDTFLRFDPYGLARAFSIIMGLAYTAWSFVRTRLARTQKADSADLIYLPKKILDVDLGSPMPRTAMADPTYGIAYGGVFCLVRRAGVPVNLVEFPFQGAVLESDLLADIVGQTQQDLAAGHVAAEVQHDAEPLVSVIIATHNRPDGLETCLNSLLAQNYHNYEIIVSDNAPGSSETADMIRSKYSVTGKVRYVRDDRPGLGIAHNKGLEIASGTIAAFTDDDVIADPQWIASVVQTFQSEANIGCVTGLILPAELETRPQYWTERHGGFGKGFKSKIFDLQANRPDSRLFPFTAGQFGSGANMSFDMHALRAIGGFDPLLGAGTATRGGDDLAAFVQIIQAGYKLAYQPAAIVWHHHRREESGIRNQAFGYGMGLGAYLAKLVSDRPRTALDLAMAFPAGLFHMFGNSSPKNKRLPADYPRSLVWRERAGIPAGVIAYLRSHMQQARHKAATGHTMEAKPAKNSTAHIAADRE